MTSQGISTYIITGLNIVLVGFQVEGKLALLAEIVGKELGIFLLLIHLDDAAAAFARNSGIFGIFGHLFFCGIRILLLVLLAGRSATKPSSHAAALDSSSSSAILYDASRISLFSFCPDMISASMSVLLLVLVEDKYSCCTSNAAAAMDRLTLQTPNLS